jgi:hypothetical protein
MQELEETVYWLELLEETGFATVETLEPLKSEADELMAIFVTIARKTKAQLKNSSFDSLLVQPGCFISVFRFHNSSFSHV